MKTPTALADFILGMYEDEDARLSSYQNRLVLAFTGRVSAAESMLEMLRARIRGGLALKIAGMEASLNVLEARMAAADPRKMLERGYALVLDGEGVVMKTAAGRMKGDRVSLMFSDGSLDCTVDAVRPVR